ncbi:J domain-containing protein [Lysobacter sp. A378]
MTGAESVVIILAGILGYWLVAVLVPYLRRDASPDEPVIPAEPDNDPTRPWHEVLGVDLQADRQEISAAYKRQMSQYHPDKVQQLAPEIRALAEQRSKEINQAFDTAIRLRK